MIQVSGGGGGGGAGYPGVTADGLTPAGLTVIGAIQAGLGNATAPGGLSIGDVFAVLGIAAAAGTEGVRGTGGVAGAVGVHALGTDAGALALFIEGNLGVAATTTHSLGAYSGNALAVYDGDVNLLGYIPLYA